MERREQLLGGENITTTEIQRITGYDLEGAEREHKHIINQLGTHSEFLSVTQYCEFNGIEENEIIEFLNQFRKEDKGTEENSEPYLTETELEAEYFLSTYNQNKTA